MPIFHALAKVEKAETVNSGSAEPDQANTCEGNKSKLLVAPVRSGSVASVTPSVV
ncbi:hypothetical protein NUKP76_47220 [Klebsiella variicola]|nr:hypothetical protein NUKP76_47220 [Klebsiella variicola]